MLASNTQYVTWEEGSNQHQARWVSQSNYPHPKRMVIIDDTTKADDAYRLANAGTSMLWRGDFHNAKQLLQAINRRIDKAEQRKKAKSSNKAINTTVVHAQNAINDADTNAVNTQRLAQLFHQKRLAQSQRSRLLSRLLLQLDADYVCRLSRAPDVSAACRDAFGDINETCVLSFRDLQGALGAAQWRKKGVPINALNLSIYPHYGVFAPTRQEYVQLLLDAPLPENCTVAYDIGTGTGLLSIILAKRGITQIMATDVNARALDCARDNLNRLQLTKVQLQQTDLFPKDVAPANLIVCNPPWIPAKPSSLLEYAVYDNKSAMLRGFLKGAKQHLAEHGEIWLILSDLAEHLQLRSRDELMSWFAEADLKVKYRLDTQATHNRSQDVTDVLYAARNAEVTSLWCLS